VRFSQTKHQSQSTPSIAGCFRARKGTVFAEGDGQVAILLIVGYLVVNSEGNGARKRRGKQLNTGQWGEQTMKEAEYRAVLCKFKKTRRRLLLCSVVW
jgi:hypothetical protein